MSNMIYDDIDDIVKNSYKNFHSKGLDYICLRRSLRLTQKIYFFDGDASKLPEVVNPHNHRYDFETKILTGDVSNIFWSEASTGDPYIKRDWFTPLNGGRGFVGESNVSLREIGREVYSKGDRYFCEAQEIHTLSIKSDSAVVLINQFEDLLPVDYATQTYFSEKESPNLDGLYERFTIDEVIKRLGTISALTPPMAN